MAARELGDRTGIRVRRVRNSHNPPRGPRVQGGRERGREGGREGGTDGRTDGRTDGWTDGQWDGGTNGVREGGLGAESLWTDAWFRL